MGRGKHNATGRSKGGGQFAAVPYLMARSLAWRLLSGAAMKVYFELHTRFNGSNNGDLSLSYQQAADALGLSKSTVRRAFDELQDKGFIVKTSQGQWYGRKASTWRLTTQKANGRPRTDDWRLWKPGKTKAGTGAARNTALRAA